MDRLTLRSAGWLAAGFDAAHVLELLVREDPADVMWACNVGSYLVAAGLLLRRATINGAGVLMLILGDILWGIHLVSGGETMPTSFLTHVGVLALGLWGLGRLGLPRPTMEVAVWSALLALAGGRFLGSAEANVNVTHGIPPEWDVLPLSHPGFFVVVMLVYFAGLLTVQLLLYRLGFSEEPALLEEGADEVPVRQRVGFG